MPFSKVKSKDGAVTVFVITNILFVISLICLFIDYSIDQIISWSLYPTGALIIFWASIVPLLLFKKNKILGSLGGLALTLLPFLYLIESQNPNQDWFFPLALPISVISILTLGIALSIFISKRFDNFTSLAAAIFLFGTIVNLGVHFVVTDFLDQNFTWNHVNIYIGLICLLVALVLLVLRPKTPPQ